MKTLITCCMLVFSFNAQASCVAVGCSCTVNIGALGFGTYNPLSTSNNTTSTILSVNCTSLLNVEIALLSYQVTASAGSSGVETARQMTSSGNTLNYNVYTDPSMINIWGEGLAGTVTVVSGSLLNILSPYQANFTIYGKLPKGQMVTPGTYNDSLIVTITF